MHTSYGVGFSTDTGPRLRFGRNNLRFNERGHQFGINAQLSPVMSEVTANYRMPIDDSRAEWLNFDAGVEREDTETAESERLEIGARRVHERPRRLDAHGAARACASRTSSSPSRRVARVC